MKNIYSILSVVLGLILIVGVHELGHAMAAFFFRVKIKRISIGFGKPLFLWKDKRGIEWVWALWPLGGFVQLQNSRIEAVVASEEKLSFDKKPIWVRLVILASGGLANMVFAWISLTLVLHIGFQQQLPVIAKVIPQSIAEKAGLSAHEQLVSMAGHKTTSWRAVGQQFVMHVGQDSMPVVVVDQKGRMHQRVLDLHLWQYPDKQESLLLSMGIEPDSSEIYRHFVPGVSLLQAAKDAGIEIGDLVYYSGVLLKQLAIGAIPFNWLLGPIGLFLALINSFYQGLAIFLYFIAYLSVAVALVNILPVPGLDGASILYALIEKITGKAPSIALEVLLYRLSFICLCLLLLHFFMNDILHLITAYVT